MIGRYKTKCSIALTPSMRKNDRIAQTNNVPFSDDLKE